MIKRRDALLSLALLTAASPGSAQRAASARRKRIGIISGETLDGMREFESPLLTALQALGWAEDENLSVERVHADGQYERLPKLAQVLVERNLDVIVSGGALTTIAAARATDAVPIVFSGALWPVEQGLIESFARPGKNITGHAFYAGVDYSTKRLQYLREVVPAAKRLSWIWPEFLFSTEKLNGGRVDMLPTFEAAATALGFETRFHLVRRDQEIDTVFRDVVSSRADAMTVAVDSGSQLAAFAFARHLPGVYALRENVLAGGLMSFGPVDTTTPSLAVRTAEYVDQILRGAKAADLPVEMPSKYELVVNMRTAKNFGIVVPNSVIQRADDLIQ